MQPAASRSAALSPWTPQLSPPPTPHHTTIHTTHTRTPALTPQVVLHSFQAEVQHSGWEGFTVHFQHAIYRSHFDVSAHEGPAAL